jgi:hypothetical protein
MGQNVSILAERFCCAYRRYQGEEKTRTWRSIERMRQGSIKPCPGHPSVRLNTIFDLVCMRRTIHPSENQCERQHCGGAHRSEQNIVYLERQPLHVRG